MKRLRIAGIVMTYAATAAWLLVACAGIRVYGPCALPKEVSENDLLGKWQLSYSNYLTDPSRVILNGDETVILNEDGTYAHMFNSSGYAYHDESNPWELVLDAPDSPKLRMHGMKYFADGTERANTQEPFDISAQMPDRLRIQDYDKNKSGEQWIRKGVTYPTDGFIYLYPRLCDGELALVQMMDPRQDPDDMSVQNPVFTRR